MLHLLQFPEYTVFLHVSVQALRPCLSFSDEIIFKGQGKGDDSSVMFSLVHQESGNFHF
jgi:hypothetical protein